MQGASRIALDEKCVTHGSNRAAVGRPERNLERRSVEGDRDAHCSRASRNVQLGRGGDLATLGTAVHGAVSGPEDPNAAEEEGDDPDVLLEKYKILVGQIEETENQLKSELAAALAHHFTGEEA